jgi:DNA-binding MarR family transcriptional regulator
MTKQKNESIIANIAELTFRLLTKCQEKEAQYAEENKISVAHFRCIRHLYQNDNTTMTQLAEYMNITTSRLSIIIDELVQKKMVLRQENITDRRYYNVKLSAKGKTVAKKLYENYIKLHADIFSSIAETQYETIAQSLKSLSDALSVWSEYKVKNK